MRPLNDTRRVDGELLYPKGHDNSGLFALHAHEEAASQASRDLNEAIRRQFRKFAWKYGISVEEAQHLLLNTGIRLPRAFMLSDAA